MSRILFLSSLYLGAAGANGICTKNIVNQLKQSGHEVFVLCYDKGEPEENVYTVKTPVLARKRSLFTKIWGRLRGIFVPQLNGALIKEYQTQALKICEEKHIEVVVGMFFPLETATVMRTIKKKFPAIRTVMYELDSVGDGIFSGSKYNVLATKAFERWNARQYRYTDRVVVMESHEEYWNKVFGKRFGDKLVLADIPVLVEKQLPSVSKTTEDPISLLYGGLIEQSYRSPDHLLAVFEAYAKKEKATLDFFSKGDCEEKIAQVAKRVQGIRQNGYVAEAILDEAIAKADALISIGNRVSRSVPSKLIAYLAFGKPIVHISLQRNDVCVHYLEKYPLGLVLNAWDPVEENAQKMYDFINTVRGKKTEFSVVAKVLKKNTPPYSAEMITGQ